MHNVSTLLKNARLDRELELSEIAKRLKIPIKYLEAIEAGDIKKFPQEPYCSLFVKDYADFLNLNSQNILILFRRDYYRQNGLPPKKNFLLSFTPQLTFTIGVFLTLVLFATYLFGEYFKFNRPPRLDIAWPAENLSPANIELTGITDPEATIRVNDDLIIVDSQGKFSAKINLTPPASKVKVESKSPAGKTTVEERELKVE